MTDSKRDQEAYECVRRAVLERDGWRCQVCGKRVNLEVHHQQFRSHGGDDSLNNLIVLCADCHRAAHTGA